MKALTLILLGAALIAFAQADNDNPGSHRREFHARAQTWGHETNAVYLLTPPRGVTRIQVEVLGFEEASGKGASYGKIGTFKRLGDAVYRIAGPVTIGMAEDDIEWEALLDTDGSNIRVRVAGGLGQRVNWTVHGSVLYED